MRDALRSALSGPLPGAKAHEEAWPPSIPSRRLEEHGLPARFAAVLLLLYPTPDGYRLPLVERPETMAHHAGQIALPGGRIEEGEDAISCALREAHEEVGIAASAVEILGQLSPVHIPVSGFVVDVVVGWAEARPLWQLDPREVTRTLEADVDRLAREGPRLSVARRLVDGVVYDVPAYAADDAIVWGATALMLAEFLWIWRGIRADSIG